MLSKVSGGVVDSILAFYERRMRALLGPLALVTLSQEPEPSEEGRAPTPTAADGGGARKARSTWRPLQDLFSSNFSTILRRRRQVASTALPETPL